MFDKLFDKVTDWLGSPKAFFLAFLVVLAWNIGGLVFGFSDTWMLLINTLTTIITFLMLFVVQGSQNKNAKAVHVKLDGMIAKGETKNSFVGLEKETHDTILKKENEILEEIKEVEEEVS